MDGASAAGQAGTGGADPGIVSLDGGVDAPPVPEDPRRPLNEVVNMIPGRKEPVLPTAAAPLPGTVGHNSPTVKSAPPGPATTEELALHAAAAAVDGAGVDGAILRSAAHLRIEGVPGGLGDVELHLRVRGDVALLRVEGAGAPAMGGRETELASALASAGLSLGRLDLPPVATATGAQAGSSGHRGGADAGPGGSQTSPQGQPEPQERGAAHRPPEPRDENDRSGRNPARGARVHVEA